MVELSSSEYMTDTKLSRFTWIPFQSNRINMLGVFEY
jgi:hypothetical protein